MNRTLRAGVAVKFTLIVTLTAILGWVSPSATAVGRSSAGIGQEQAGQKGGKEKAVSKPEKKFIKKEKAIRGEYVVVLDDDVVGEPGKHSWAADVPDELVRIYGGKVRDRFKHAINAFTASMTEAEALAMSEDPMVAYVQEEYRGIARGRPDPGDMGHRSYRSAAPDVDQQLFVQLHGRRRDGVCRRYRD